MGRSNELGSCDAAGLVPGQGTIFRFLRTGAYRALRVFKKPADCAESIGCAKDILATGTQPHRKLYCRRCGVLFQKMGKP